MNKPIRPTRNVSYENVYQNKLKTKSIKPTQTFIDDSLLPSKSIFQGAVQDSYINPMLLQNKKSDVYVNPMLL